MKKDRHFVPLRHGGKCKTLRKFCILACWLFCGLTVQAAGYAHFVQLLGYALRRAELLEARLRVHVEVAAHLHDVGIDLVGQLFDVSHSVLLSGCA